MCGIWFSVGFPPDPQCLDIVVHRGPDGRGWKVFDSAAGPLVLGHQRLAIIDVSDAGLQPMPYRDGRYWLIFNGEIYNYVELREQLQALGHEFFTHSDSEVILAAYAEWGESSTDRFIGMFAFVIYDRLEETIFAVRDRFGIKPLYYVATTHGFAFASEIKQLLRLPAVASRANKARLYDFLLSGMTDHTDETLFDGIRQFRNGECATFSIGRDRFESLRMRRWYSLPPSGQIRISETEAAEQFRHLLTESVRLHLRSDVPVGSCLSGGLDSSAIVSLIDRQMQAQRSHSPLNTISACYAEQRVDERPFIDAVVGATRVRPHYVFPPVDDVFALADRITWHQDEPYGSTSIYAQWNVFQRARQEQVKVMLDGQGADEQLAGYHGGFFYYITSLLRRRRYASLVRAIVERWRYNGVSIEEQLRLLGWPRPILKVLSKLKRGNVQASASEHWLQSDTFRDTKLTSAFDEALKREGLYPIQDIGTLCVAMVQATNLQMLLHYEDRNSMAHSVEARVPFLDHRLVEFSIGLGERYKMVGGETKRVLRRAMRGIMPDKICNRRDKLGFATPEEEWFRGPLRPAIEEGVESTLKLYPGLLNELATRRLMNEMLNGARAIDFTIWRIINVGIWGRKFGVSV